MSTALRYGSIEVTVCHGTTPEELERAINAALKALATKSSDPQLIDIKMPQATCVPGEISPREYLALVIWQR